MDANEPKNARLRSALGQCSQLAVAE